MTPFTAVCEVCGHSWIVDLDTYTPVREIYKSIGDARVKVESYHFKCPRCGEHFIQPVEITEANNAKGEA